MQLQSGFFLQGPVVKRMAHRIGESQQKAGIRLYQYAVPAFFEADACSAVDRQVFFPGRVIDRQHPVDPDLDLGTGEHIQDSVAADG